MRRASWLLVPGLVLALAGCRAGTFRAGYGVQNGAALAPPTTSRGTTAMVTYHERGGPVWSGTMYVLALLGTDFESEDIVVIEETETSITFRDTTDAERSAAEAGNRAKINAAQSNLSGGAPVEVNFAVAAPKLGGDSSGYIAEALFVAPIDNRIEIAIGLGAQRFTFADRDYRTIVVDPPGTFRTTDVTGDVGYGFFGHPFRVTYHLNRHLGMFVRWDLNYRTLGDSRPSPVTLGATLSYVLIHLRATMMSNGRDVGSTTFGFEASLGF